MLKLRPHAPHFVRAFRFSDVSAELYKIATAGLSLPSQNVAAEELRKNWFKRELALVDAVTSDDPSLLRPAQALSQTGSIALNEQDLLDYFKEVYTFEDGINCPPHSCVVGRLKSHRDGFIEITRRRNSNSSGSSSGASG